jgi:hypothetical protein
MAGSSAITTLVLHSQVNWDNRRSNTHQFCERLHKANVNVITRAQVTAVAQPGVPKYPLCGGCRFPSKGGQAACR